MNRGVNSKYLQYYLGIVFVLGTYLRLWNLGLPPLWIDEALFAGWAKGTPHQEYLTVYLAKLLPDSEFYLRLPVAICGSLTILFFYFVTGRGWKSFYGSAFIAVFPIFVFWSRMARPYAFAGLFIVLGWRWWGFYVLAILTTPIALIGLNLLKLKERRFWYIYAVLAVLAFVVYYLRPDVKEVGDFVDWKFFLIQSRIWYVPILTLLLYCCSYFSGNSFVANSEKDIRKS